MVTLNLRYAEFNTHAWHHRGDIHLLYCFWLLYNNCAKWGKFSCSCKARRNKDSLQHKNVCFLSFFSPHFSVCIRKNVERPEYCCSKTEFLKKSMCNCCYSHKCCNYLQSVKKSLKRKHTSTFDWQSVTILNVIAFYCHEGIYARE